MSALRRQKWYIVPALGRNFNCCITVGKNLSVWLPVNLIKEWPPDADDIVKITIVQIKAQVNSEYGIHSVPEKASHF